MRTNRRLSGDEVGSTMYQKQSRFNALNAALFVTKLMVELRCGTKIQKILSSTSSNLFGDNHKEIIWKHFHFLGIRKIKLCETLMGEHFRRKDPKVL